MGIVATSLTIPKPRVVAGRHTCKHTDASLAHARGGVSSSLERLPATFKEQPLLWIHAPRLVRRDREQLSIKARHVVEKSALAPGEG